MGLSYQEHWSEILFHSPGDLPNPREEPVSPEAPALVGEFFTTDLASPTHYTKKVIKDHHSPNEKTEDEIIFLMGI